MNQKLRLWASVVRQQAVPFLSRLIVVATFPFIVYGTFMGQDMIRPFIFFLVGVLLVIWENVDEMVKRFRGSSVSKTLSEIQFEDMRVEFDPNCGPSSIQKARVTIGCRMSFETWRSLESELLRVGIKPNRRYYLDEDREREVADLRAE